MAEVGALVSVTGGLAGDPLAVMLEARSVALVGASPRPGSFGARMAKEVAKSASRPRTYLVNPRYAEVGGVGCYPSLAELPEAVDVALLAVPDSALEEQVQVAASGAARSAVIFGSAVDPGGQAAPGPRGERGPGLRERIAVVAREAGMPLCGAGCMGFVNVARGLRAIGYTERDPLPAGPVALVTHSGSVFSALLRSRRAFGFTVAVSSGQELVTSAAAYARYALTLPETKVLALVLEAIRDAAALRSVLADAAGRDVPVLLLTAGTSAASRPLVAAHSGALAAGDGAWQALARAYGVHRVGDLAELADTLELFCLTRSHAGTAKGDFASGHDTESVAGGGHERARPASGGRGIATVHDSGFERAHVADIAAEAGVPFAPLTAETRRRLAAVLDPGLEPGNPLDVWGTGRDTAELFTESLSALADDPGVDAVALAVDLVPEFDGDDSYRDAVLAAAAKTGKPVTVLAAIPAAIDEAAASRLRAAGVPVLESTRTGLLALRHLLAHTTSVTLLAHAPADAALTGHLRPLSALAPDGCDTHTAAAVSLPQPSGPPGSTRGVKSGPWGQSESRGRSEPDEARRGRWAARLATGPLGAADLFGMLRDYGIPAVAARSAGTRDEALAAAGAIGYPVALKTGRPDIAHKSDTGGVRLGIASPESLAAAYRDLSERLGPEVTVCAMAGSGQELILGMARDEALGPLIVVGAGGVLTEYLAERAVALPPLTRESASALLDGQRFASLLGGVRGAPPCDIDAVVSAIAAFSVLVADLGDHLDGFDINPLICSPSGVLAVDALAVPSAAPRPLLA